MVHPNPGESLRMGGSSSFSLRSQIWRNVTVGARDLGPRGRGCRGSHSPKALCNVNEGRGHMSVTRPMGHDARKSFEWWNYKRHGCKLLPSHCKPYKKVIFPVIPNPSIKIESDHVCFNLSNQFFAVAEPACAACGPAECFRLKMLWFFIWAMEMADPFPPLPEVWR